MIASLRSRRSLLGLLSLGAPLALAGACGSAPPIVGTGNEGPIDSGGVHFDATSGSDGAKTSGDGSAVSSEASLGDGSELADASGADDAADADAGPAPPLCSPDASIGLGTLAVGTPDPDLLGAVTPDELVVAWTSIPSDGGGPSVNWAERTSTSVPFGPVQALDPTFGPFPFGKVGLSGDGLRLVVASADYTQITEITRAAPGTPFATAADADFPSVNPTGGSDGNPGLGPFVSMALSPDFGLWAFVNNKGFVVTARQLGVWPPGVSPPGLDANDDSGVTTMDPTGWSSDDLTLFFWNQTLGAEQMAWRDPGSLSFGTIVTLGSQQQYAYPAAGCTDVYYSAPGLAGDLDIFVAPFQ